MEYYDGMALGNLHKVEHDPILKMWLVPFRILQWHMIAGPPFLDT